jgi:type IV pilus assembly protein PilA
LSPPIPRSARKIDAGFTLIELMIVVAIIGVLAVLAIFGVSRYLKNARSAEATNTLGAINQAAVIAYNNESAASTTTVGAAGAGSHQLCPSSVGAIPPTPPKNKKYTANPAGDYLTDAGFHCLKFEMNQPQYFAYDYVNGGVSAIAPAAAATITGLTGWSTGAAADFDGDGVNFVEFATGGNIVNGQPITSTSIAGWDVKSGSAL